MARRMEWLYQSPVASRQCGAAQDGLKDGRLKSNAKIENQKSKIRNYVMLVSVYVPYTCFSASQISPPVA